MSDSVGKRMAVLDRYLTLWIFSAMLLGVGLGYLFPELIAGLNDFQVDQHPSLLPLDLFS